MGAKLLGLSSGAGVAASVSRCGGLGLGCTWLNVVVLHSEVRVDGCILLQHFLYAYECPMPGIYKVSTFHRTVLSQHVRH
jgi:hypothetical protein